MSDPCGQLARVRFSADDVHCRRGAAVSNPSRPSVHLALALSCVAVDVISGASWPASKAAFVSCEPYHVTIPAALDAVACTIS